MLRSTFAVIHAEVYLCLRMLFLKYSVQHMSGFWPVVATDMQVYLAEIKVPVEG